jgi:hypothetical protein
MESVFAGKHLLKNKAAAYWLGSGAATSGRQCGV